MFVMDQEERKKIRKLSKDFYYEYNMGKFQAELEIIKNLYLPVIIVIGGIALIVAFFRYLINLF